MSSAVKAEDTGPPGKSQQDIFIDHNKLEKGNYAGHLLLGSRGLLSFRVKGGIGAGSGNLC